MDWTRKTGKIYGYTNLSFIIFNNNQFDFLRFTNLLLASLNACPIVNLGFLEMQNLLDFRNYQKFRNLLNFEITRFFAEIVEFPYNVFRQIDFFENDKLTNLMDVNFNCNNYFNLNFRNYALANSKFRVLFTQIIEF